jgi:hypothetical protein
MEQQWKQNQHQLSEEEFVNTVNFFHDFRKPELEGKSDEATSRDYNDNGTGLSQENEDEAEGNFEEIYHLANNHPTSHCKGKTIRKCRHKLQQRTGCNHRSRKE